MRTNAWMIWWRTICAAGMLALLVAVPADGGRAGDEDDGGAPATTSQTMLVGGWAPVSHCSARPRRRRDKFCPGPRGEPAAGVIDGAAEYLRCRSRQVSPGAAAAAAWEQFYAWCDSRIRQFAGARGVDVDECAQDVWADLTARLPTFAVDHSRGCFGTWLYAVVRNKSVDLIRRHSRLPSVSLSAPEAAGLGDGRDDPSRSCERRSEREAVRRVLDEVKGSSSERSYRVLQMRYLEGKRVAEVALALGMTPGQVWAREHRIKRKFRELYLMGREK